MYALMCKINRFAYAYKFSNSGVNSCHKNILFFFAIFCAMQISCDSQPSLGLVNANASAVIRCYSGSLLIYDGQSIGLPELMRIPGSIIFIEAGNRQDIIVPSSSCIVRYIKNNAVEGQ